jgi:uncharacterized protein (TIGR03000 family)
MYSLVLMSALATVPETPGFHGFFCDLLAPWSMAGCQGVSMAPRYGCAGGCAGRITAGSCSGAAFSMGCYGTSYPTGCNGCQGEGLIARLRRFFDRGNCQGRFYSAGCTGCYGSFSLGCLGAAYPAGCYGSVALACYGSPSFLVTPTFGGGTSCSGGFIPLAPPPSFDTPGGTSPLPSVPPPTIPYAPPETAPPPGSARHLLTPSELPAVPTGSGATGQRGTVVIRLPADARLFAENRLLRQTGPERMFVTPPLPTQREYTYRFHVEYDRQGETVSVSRLVKVRPGETVQVIFTDLTAHRSSEGDLREGDARSSDRLARGAASSDRDSKQAPAPSPQTTASPTNTEKNGADGPQPTPASASPSVPNQRHTDTDPSDAKAVSPPSSKLTSNTTAHFAQPEAVHFARPEAIGQSLASRQGHPSTASAMLIVKLPAGATLYVNDQPLPSSSQTVRHFRTPPLPMGQEYAYLLRVEYIRNGQRESLTQKIPFRAGEQIELDLTSGGP